MILITILTLILVILIAAAIAMVAIGGGMFVILFADIIVCALFIGWLIKRLIKRRK